MRTYIFRFLIISSHVSGLLAAVKMKCNARSFDRSAELTCVASLKCGQQIKIDLLAWKKDSMTLVLVTGNGIENKQPERFELKQETWNTSSWTFPLQINNINSQDEGEYSFSVLSDCGSWEGSVYLDLPDTTKLPDLTTTPSSAVTGVQRKQWNTSPSSENPGRHNAALAGILVTLFVLIAVVVAVRKRHPIQEQLSKLRSTFCKRTTQADEEHDQYTNHSSVEPDPV